MNAPELIRLNCVRCGDWHERELGDPYLPELCGRCFSRTLEYADHYADYAAALGRYIERFRRGTQRHPTMLALTKAWGRYTDTASTGDGESPW